jgi:hypothetical protein
MTFTGDHLTTLPWSLVTLSGKGKTAAEWAVIKGHSEVAALFAASLADDVTEAQEPNSDNDDSEEETSCIAGMRRTGTAAVQQHPPSTTMTPEAEKEQEDQSGSDWRFWRLPVASITEDDTEL